MPLPEHYKILKSMQRLISDDLQCHLQDSIWSASSYILQIYHKQPEPIDNISPGILHAVFSVDKVLLENMTLLELYEFIDAKLSLKCCTKQLPCKDAKYSFSLQLFEFVLCKTAHMKIKTIIGLIKRSSMNVLADWLLHEHHGILPLVLSFDSEDDHQLESFASVPVLNIGQESISPMTDDRFQIDLLVDRVNDLGKRMLDMQPMNTASEAALNILSEEAMRIVLAWDTLNITLQDDKKIRHENVQTLLSICEDIDHQQASRRISGKDK